MWYINYPLTGVSVCLVVQMVGVGTGNVDMDAYRYNFCSFLGRDSDSWGLSYYGKAQFRGVFTDVAGARFGQGSIIGVHLDTWLGRLLFYKNRRPLGERSRTISVCLLLLIRMKTESVVFISRHGYTE